jgi:hypothetical protein
MRNGRDESETVLEATENLADMIGLHGEAYGHLFDRCFCYGNVPRSPFLKFPDASPLFLIDPLRTLIEAVIDTCGRRHRHRFVIYGFKDSPISLEDTGIGVKADNETGMLLSVVYPHQVVLWTLRHTKYPESFARVAQWYAADSYVSQVTVKHVIDFAWQTEPDRRFLEYV